MTDIVTSIIIVVIVSFLVFMVIISDKQNHEYVSQQEKRAIESNLCKEPFKISCFGLLGCQTYCLNEQKEMVQFECEQGYCYFVKE